MTSSRVNIANCEKESLLMSTPALNCYEDNLQRDNAWSRTHISRYMLSGHCRDHCPGVRCPHVAAFIAERSALDGGHVVYVKRRRDIGR